MFTARRPAARFCFVSFLVCVARTVMKRPILPVLSLSLVALSMGAYIPVKVVPNAAPTIASNSPAPATALVARRRAVATGYVVPSDRTSSFKQNFVGPLFAKKKKGGAGKSSQKIQVKLLKYVEGTGSVGDVVKVAPAFFENKLKRTQSAVIVTDEEVAKENAKQAAEKKDKLDAATSMKEKIDGMDLVLSKKAGPEGHLFGGIGNKAILDELKGKFPKGSLDGKQVKIVSIKGEDGKALKHDIKEVGSFSAKVSLLKDVTADFQISVVSDE